MQIKFQTALITGSSRGLGRQIALKLASEGVRKIAIHYRTGRFDAETTLSLIESAGASGVLVRGDVADPVAAEDLVKEAAQKLGGCDIFVQSVVPRLNEIYAHVMSTELPLEKWQLAFDTQARAFFIGARTAAKFMRGGGRIIGMSYSLSGRTGGWQPWVGMGSAKAAMDSVSRYFAVALGRYANYGEYGESWNVGCRCDGADSARVSRCGSGMGIVGMDAYATAGHSGGCCGCVCVAVQR
jgi:enoyl-[acyl-carrier protein] reductase III